MARACYWIVSVSRRTIRQRAGIPGGGDASPANPVRNPASGRPLQILDPDLPEFERSLRRTAPSPPRHGDSAESVCSGSRCAHEGASLSGSHCCGAA